MANKDLKDVFENGRSFQMEDSGLMYYIIPPDAESAAKAKWHYSKMYSKAFMDGVSTVAEMRDALLKRGLIGEAFDSKLQELINDRDIMVSELESVSDIDEREALAIKIAEKRDEIYAWSQRASAPLSQTAESLAEDSQTDFLTTCMVVGEDGKKIWADYDSFVKEKDQMLAMRARYECIMFLQGFESDFLENLPENKILREVMEERQKEAEAEAEEDVEVEEEKPKKKKSTKKKND